MRTNDVLTTSANAVIFVHWPSVFYNPRESMPLTIGSQLGSHEIVALLGKGGMGEVYRARDLKLKREVAIKILPEEFSRDEDRVRRFQREAEVLASLNHPNIAGIYDLEEANDSRFLVLELIEGETLADRLARGPLPLDEALGIARSICEGLAAAHEKGLVHRDLKPGNIKVTPDGKVKVLDFGLAKLAAQEFSSSQNAFSNSPTMLSAATGAGIILGTAAYMSPEQARGKAVDRRADVWAFGCVLYEMLTGEQAFKGEIITDVIAGIIKADPDWKLLPADVPLVVRSLLRRCLEKDPNRRLHEIADARIEIDDAIAAPAVAETAGAAGHRQTWHWLVSAGSLIGLVCVLAWIMFHNTPPPDTPLIRLSLMAPEMQAPFGLALSPDGRRLAFVGTSSDGKVQLYVRNLDAPKPVPIQGTDGGEFPFWSPDSHSIGFFAEGKLKKVDVFGGPVLTICDVPPIHPGGTWSSHGVILFSSLDGGLLQVADTGGTPTVVTEVDSSRSEIFHNFPHFLPDGQHFLFEVVSTDPEKSAAYIGSLNSKARNLLQVTGDSMPIYAAPGYFLFNRNGTVMSQAFDPKRLQLSGNAVPVAEQVSSVYGYAAFSTSDTGLLAYHAGGNTQTKVQLTWYDRMGKPIENVGSPASYVGLDLSPDGKRVAVHQHDSSGGDIWLMEPARRTNVRYTFDAREDNSSPIWSPDGRFIAFSSYRSGLWGLYKKPSSGAGTEELLFQSSSTKVPMDWSPDGSSILYWEFGVNALQSIFVLPLTGERKPRVLYQSKSFIGHPQFSSDGKWIAYENVDNAGAEIYVEPFPPTGAKWQISTGGGTFPRWSRDGREVYYMSQVSGGKIMAVEIAADGATLKPGVPRALFDSPYVNFPHSSNYHTFAVSRDGQRFLIPHPAGKEKVSTESLPITVVVNWTAPFNKK